MFGVSEDTIAAAVAAAAEDATPAEGSSHDLRGGETAAAERLRAFLARGGASASERAAAGVGRDGSARLSAYLAFGCVSAREARPRLSFFFCFHPTLYI